MNKNRKTWILAIIATGVLGGMAVIQAASDEPSPAAAGRRLAQWRERIQEAAANLDLTDAQKEQLKTMFQGEMEKLREVWLDPNLSWDEKMEKFKALRTEAEPKLKGVLTPEQLEKWQAQSGDRKPDSVKDLNLTDDQKAKLKTILQSQLGRLRDLREDQTLSPQEKRENAKAMDDEYEPQIKQVLTPEQYGKWQRILEQKVAEARERAQQGRQQ